MINPFFIFVLTFVAVLVMYGLGFSEIYPTISFSLLFFLGVIFALMILVGIWVYKKKIIKSYSIKSNTNVILLTVIVLGLIVVEGLYSHGLPLTNMLLIRDSGYAEFGIPTLHVIIMTFAAFLSMYIFHLLLSHFSKTLLVVYLVSLLPSVLVVNRGMLMMILMNCLWVFLIYFGKKIKVRYILALIPIGLVGLFAFGVMGNARLNTSYQNGKNMFDSTTFLNIGKASDSFDNSGIPDEFFWTYVYATSPLANLQKNISANNTESQLGVRQLNGFVFNDIIPDFIGKRISEGKNYKPIKTLQVTQELNVSSAFIGPFKWLGWLGMLLYCLILVSIAIVYILLLHKISSQFFVVGLATVNTVFLFSFFANMLSFTGLIFQLVYPLVFTVWNSWCEEKNKKFLEI